MTKDLQQWWRAVTAEGRRVEDLAHMPSAVALVAERIKADGHTAAIRIMCSRHKTGWEVALKIEGAAIRPVFMRQSAAAPNSLQGVTLRGLEWPSSYDITCASCGRYTSVKASRLLYLAIQAVLPDTRTGNAPHLLSIT
ncbi:hypothetical protein [Microbacterium sp.]|uniref:hypothetical protein n=1 Tax=Microbacterium sp. TaxID=51671 RepID=UPI003734DB63